MRKSVIIKISLNVNKKTNSSPKSNQNFKKAAHTSSAFSLKTSNMAKMQKDYRYHSNNKHLICNTSPNSKIGKNLNLTRAIQNISTQSLSKEPKLNNKILNGTYQNRMNFLHAASTGNRSQSTNFTQKEMEQKTKFQKISEPKQNYVYANLKNVRISHKPYGIIHAYSVITSCGKRNYNEDRVSIIYNIPKPSNFVESKKNPWPNCSFFGLYDGHGGSKACDFLRDNLHKYIINDKYFPSNPQKAIANGFIMAEKIFFKNYTGIDSSGSCALVVLIIENRVFIANVGDSRAILSAKNGNKFYALSRDHRPGDDKEYKRIIKAGGKIYKTEYEYDNANNANSNKDLSNKSKSKNTTNQHKKISSFIGPLRVSPGKLSVSRTIGDIEAKEPKYGGNPNVIISIPEIRYFDNTDRNDFIVMMCDGIYEKLKNKDIIDCIWQEINKNKFQDIHNVAGYTIDKLVQKCISSGSSDNLTVIIICLKSYEKLRQTETQIPQTENIDQIKTKKLNLGINLQKRSQSKKPLSVLLTQLIHNNTQNVRKVINLKSKDGKKK